MIDINVLRIVSIGLLAIFIFCITFWCYTGLRDKDKILDKDKK